MFGLSASELVVVLFLLFIVVSAGHVPRIGEAIGELVAGYRKGAREDDERIQVRPRDPKP